MRDTSGPSLNVEQSLYDVCVVAQDAAAQHFIPYRLGKNYRIAVAEERERMAFVVK
ncbi:MAG: hypothetical protein IAF94_10265, partial [Pirellulaceae bacterium]|nr:hypothetical protein [Pirellulaceae bacterium]